MATTAARSQVYFARARRLPRTLIIGGVILAFYIFVALTGRFWAPYDFARTGTGRRQSSQSACWSWTGRAPRPRRAPRG